MFSSGKLINRILGFLLFFVFIAQGYWLAKGLPKTEPLTVISAAADPDVVQRGADHITVKFITLRRRLCATDTDRFIIDLNGTIYARERVLGIGVGTTNVPTTVITSVPIPSNLSPGQYTFRGFIFSNCGLNDFHGIQQPDVVFTVGE